jgi:molybdopterin converting factor subunit 1
VRVKAKLFAGIRELVGASEVVVDLPDGATVRDLEERLGCDYPRLEPLLPSLAFAVDEEYTARDHVLHDGNEVAVIPPISGGAIIDLTEERLDPGPVIDAVLHPGSGAVVVFLGTVRDEDQGRKVRYLEYDAYRSMAEKEMQRIGEELLARWPAARIAMRHRFGRLEVSETALVIAVSAPHRADAFEACRYAIDRIKEIVPIWKKEVWDDGEAWLEGHPAIG